MKKNRRRLCAAFLATVLSLSGCAGVNGVGSSKPVNPVSVTDTHPVAETLHKVTVTEKESLLSPLAPAEIPENSLEDPAPHGHYRSKTFDDRIDFTLWRTRDDLTNLLREAESLGVTLAVGLWQELN